MSTNEQSNNGSLVVVGTGIRVVGHLTTEAIAWMRQADRLLYLVGDPVAEATIHRLNTSSAESLFPLYVDGKPRIAIYNAIVDRILACVRSGMLTCVAVYGHPGVFAMPFHKAVHQARTEGYRARMLPAISAEDCLFADLGIDPATHGCQSFEATEFLMNGRIADPSVGLILWQIGLVGDPLYRKSGYGTSLLPLLVEQLCQSHQPDHVCTIYEAALYPEIDPRIDKTTLRRLPQAAPTTLSTLYVPPSRPASANQFMLSRIGAAMAAAGAPSILGARESSAPNQA